MKLSVGVNPVLIVGRKLNLLTLHTWAKNWAAMPGRGTLIKGRWEMICIDATFDIRSTKEPFIENSITKLIKKTHRYMFSTRMYLSEATCIGIGSKIVYPSGKESKLAS